MNISSLLNDSDDDSSDEIVDDKVVIIPYSRSSSQSLSQSPQQDHSHSINTIVNLLNCPSCNRLFSNPVTFSCGNTFCRSCLPQDSTIESCGEIHHEDDARIDVTIKQLSDKCRNSLYNINSSATNINSILNNDDDDDDYNNNYNYNDNNNYNSNNYNYNYNHRDTRNNTNNYNDRDDNNNNNNNNSTSISSSSSSSRSSSLNQMINDMIQDVECTVCYHIFLDPVTISCGHTFCKSCLTRTLDHFRSCPLCRHPLQDYALVFNSPVNKTLAMFTRSMYPSLIFDRIRLAESELRETPLFASILIFPGMPCLIEISEAPYKLMLRRCLDSRTRQFGMVLRRGSSDYHEYGTMLDIKSCRALDDGRLIVETVGAYRFKILSRWKKDGYDVGNIERIDDISPDEEAALERDDIRRAEMNNRNPMNARMYEPKTSELVDKANEFIEILKNGNAPWLLRYLNTTYGTVPNNLSDFSFWAASVIPVDESEKYRLLEKRSIRERLKMIISWIDLSRGQWWYSRDCVIS